MTAVISTHDRSVFIFLAEAYVQTTQKRCTIGVSRKPSRLDAEPGSSRPLCMAAYLSRFSFDPVPRPLLFT
ncbi:hypothetical protein [Paraburkholderia humisilvae]|uniref:hypothetical protein n=1 Tax=Paraburkholderia humisilvae TaxID=627669 RepID=UPI0015816B94|nr:hypothetical protein [Paraburkholderia humisilvae]